MDFDFENKDSYYQTDKYDRVVVKERPSSRRDSGGRTYNALDTYEDQRFYHSLLLGVNIVWRDKIPEIIWSRHPDEPLGDMSRDHVNYILLAIKEAGDTKLLKFIAKHTKKRISDKHKFTRDMWLWMKAIAGSKKHLRRYYRWTWVGSFVIPWWNAAIRWYAEIPDECIQEDWDLDMARYATDLQKSARKWVYPAYAIGGKVYQLSALPESKVLKRRRKRLLGMVGKTNWLLRLKLFDPKLRSPDFDTSLITDYMQMSSDRWSTTLDPLTSRHIEIQWGEVHNLLEKDNLSKAWVIYNHLFSN